MRFHAVFKVLFFFRKRSLPTNVSFHEVWSKINKMNAKLMMRNYINGVIDLSELKNWRNWALLSKRAIFGDIGGATCVQSRNETQNEVTKLWKKCLISWNLTQVFNWKVVIYHFRHFQCKISTRFSHENLKIGSGENLVAIFATELEWWKEWHIDLVQTDIFCSNLVNFKQFHQKLSLK